VPSLLGSHPFLLTAPASLAAKAVVDAASLEDDVATPIRAPRQPVGIEVVVLRRVIGEQVDASSEPPSQWRTNKPAWSTPIANMAPTVKWQLNVDSNRHT